MAFRKKLKTKQRTSKQINNNVGEEHKTQTVVVVQPSVYSGLYTGYFERIEDTNDYQEDMEPWLRDPKAAKNYLFRCMTINNDTETSVTDAGCCKGKSEAKEAEKEQTSVYHKVNSKRLIVKKKEQISSVAQLKKNPCCTFAILLTLVGVILFIAAIAGGDSGGLYGVGVVILIIGVILCFVGKRGSAQTHNFIMVSQSIPVNSIFYVDRQVEQQSELRGVSCGSCCFKQEEARTHYSTISIGYNRSNLSDKFNASASTKDFITVTLVSNQAYNLHQYLNCIIDGTHPYFNNIKIGHSYTDDNQLSRF